MDAARPAGAVAMSVRPIGGGVAALCEPEAFEPEGAGPETAAALERELQWFARVLNVRFRLYFPVQEAPPEVSDIRRLEPPMAEGASPWSQFLRKRNLRWPERLALVLALVPHLRPHLLDVFFTKNSTFDRRFAEFGGVVHDDSFEPTAETLAFLLGGDSVTGRLEAAALVASGHPLMATDVLYCAVDSAEQPRQKAPLRVKTAWLDWLLLEAPIAPAPSLELPIRKLETKLQWEDLVLHPGTLKQLLEIRTFIQHGDTLLQRWGMAKRLRPGYRALFYGPPGTGKTMSATLLGKLTGMEVYRIDLSMVMSKYIGETEQRLARVFDFAERGGAILFCDECDSLFSRRTEVKDSHDVHANQQVSYLLQRIETFSGIAILASNLKDNVDEAFNRRFESVIYFPFPKASERAQHWRRAMPAQANLQPDVDLAALAKDHELSGSSIVNVIRHVSLMAIAEGERAIAQQDFSHAIRRELIKEGRG